MKVSFDKYSLLIDGKREFINSAAFHYFRSPGFEIWQDRLEKLKAGGYNTVDIYFSWNFHSPKKGEYDFSGLRDVRKLLSLIEKMGFFVIARPGPYINAETNLGGFPFWLLEEDINIRNKNGNDFQYDKKYMGYVKEWFSQIIPIINEFNNVICVQIENEYSTNEMEPQYLQELYKLTRELGVKVPLFHNDAYCAGLYADEVDIYGFDLYPYINPEQEWRKETFCFDMLDNLEESLKPFKPDAPMFIPELQAGWFDKWKGKGDEHIRQSLGREHINIMTKTALAQGVTMFNHYMGCGGTSWGDLACDEVYSAYEFAAPISEAGLLKENFYKAKEINYFLNAFNLSCTDNKENNLFENTEFVWSKLRKDSINNCNWLFIRNFHKEDQKITLKNDISFTLKTFDIKILPQNLEVAGCKIDFSSYQLLGKIGKNNHEIYFVINEKDNILKLSEFETIESDENITVDIKNDKAFITSHDENVSLKSVKTIKNGHVTEFVFLNQNDCDKAWLQSDKAIIGADFLLNDKIAFDSSRDYFEIDLNKHSTFITKNADIKVCQQEFKIENIKLENASYEIENPIDANWRKIKNKIDIASNGIFGEFIWYKTSFKERINEIKINAKNCFAVYLNGIQIFEHDSYCYEGLNETDETISFPVDKRFLEEENELTILVQNLGFNKGFSCDLNIPRGLVSFESSPNIKLNWYIKEGFQADNIYKTSVLKSKKSYLQKLSFEFNLEKVEDTFKPLYISLQEMPFERAALFINGYKIGRYIKTLGAQEDFYLIDSFLKEKNEITLLIWHKNNETQQIHDFKFLQNNVIIKIGNIRPYKLLTR